jgi:hypothetical protein
MLASLALVALLVFVVWLTPHRENFVFDMKRRHSAKQNIPKWNFNNFGGTRDVTAWADRWIKKKR